MIPGAKGFKVETATTLALRYKYVGSQLRGWSQAQDSKHSANGTLA
jgi:hypothetical protein